MSDQADALRRLVRERAGPTALADPGPPAAPAAMREAPRERPPRGRRVGLLAALAGRWAIGRPAR